VTSCRWASASGSCCWWWWAWCWWPARSGWPRRASGSGGGWARRAGCRPTCRSAAQRAPAEEAAQRQFAQRQAETEAAPQDWRAWFRLALAYADARDNVRGRRAMRKAVALERAERTG
jgi:hypothetical protein